MGADCSLIFNRMDLLLLLLVTFFSEITGQSDRLSRRQRILSILQTYQPTTAPVFRTYSYSFESSNSGVARDRRPTTWVSWNTEWYGGNPARNTPPQPGNLRSLRMICGTIEMME